jgi:hypothetical protein
MKALYDGYRSRSGAPRDRWSIRSASSSFSTDASSRSGNPGARRTLKCPAMQTVILMTTVTAGHTGSGKRQGRPRSSQVRCIGGLRVGRPPGHGCRLATAPRHDRRAAGRTGSSGGSGSGHSLSSRRCREAEEGRPLLFHTDFDLDGGLAEGCRFEFAGKKVETECNAMWR